jgi:serine protease
MWLRRGFPALCASLFALLAGCATAPQQQTSITHEGIVSLERPPAPGELERFERRFGVRLIPNSTYAGAGRLYRFTYNETDPVRAEVFFRTLEATDLVEEAEPNYVYRALGFPNDPLYPQQWNLKAIHMEDAWQRANGEGAVVAVIDTGIARNLPDLRQTEFVDGYDFVNDNREASDDQGHGSHVAGTIAQSTDNGEGVAGIAYRARLMPVKVLDGQGYGTLADVAEGIRYAADHGANVINLSLGGGGDSPVLRDAVDYAARKGVVLVCAAGNEDSPSSSYPAAYGNCLSVAATGPSGERSFYSNYGRSVNISAPGGDKRGGPEGGILQNTLDPADGNPVYASYQGTSMAAPHVAGVAALLYSAGVHDATTIRKALLSSARTATDDWRNEHGTGRLDARAALAILDSPTVFWRGGFSWMIPLATLAAGTFLGFVALRLTGSGTEPINDSFYGLGFVLFGLGVFPLQAVGTLVGPEGWLTLLATPIPQWDRLLFEGLLNPVLHSLAVPGLLAFLLGGNNWGRSFAIGACVGTAALLVLQASLFYQPLMWFEQEDYARIFLLANAAACLVLAFFAHKFGQSPR